MFYVARHVSLHQPTFPRRRILFIYFLHLALSEYKKRKKTDMYRKYQITTGTSMCTFHTASLWIETFKMYQNCLPLESYTSC